MNIKEYLMTNSSPLLENPKNILVLEWLEGNSFCTPAEISTRTNISLKEISEIIQILYKNNLVAYNNDKYEITIDGIKLIDKLGLADLQISTLLNQADFQPEEYSIYKSIFHEWRSNFTSIYLFFSYTIKNEYEKICMPFSHIISSKKAGHTTLIASLLHKFSKILYTEENSNLMKYYNELFEYSLINHCLSSEVYHNTSKYWNPDKNHILLVSSFNNSLNVFWEKTFNTFHSNNSNYALLPGNHDINNINHDFLTSYNLMKNPELISRIFASQNIAELSKELNLNENQTKFILKYIRSKIDILLQNGETNVTNIKNSN